VTKTARSRTSPITGVRVATLMIIWLAAVFLAAPRLGLYYEALAVCYVVPPLGLNYAYCISHRGRATAYLVVVATVVAVVAIGFAVLIPKGSAA
jgi:hypothetical protein